MSSRIAHRVAAGSAVLLLLAAGCGGDDGDATPTTTQAPAAAPTTAGATTTTRAAATTAPATTASGPVQCDKVDIASAANKAEYNLTTAFKVDGPNTLKAGANGITVKVVGGQHELKILKGTVASQPRKANNAIDEARLAAGALVFKANPGAGGSSCTGLVTLTAGDYSFVCNIEFGNTSHAANGQVLDVKVS